MLRRITVTLREEESKALGHLAEMKRRSPRDQAAVLIRQALEHDGYLPPVSLPVQQQAQSKEV